MRRRLWRLLQELFGEPPPPRPTGSGVGPVGVHGRTGVHGERGGEEDDLLLDAAGGPGPAPGRGQAPGPAGPAMDAGHGHGHNPHP